MVHVFGFWFILSEQFISSVWLVQCTLLQHTEVCGSQHGKDAYCSVLGHDTSWSGRRVHRLSLDAFRLLIVIDIGHSNGDASGSCIALSFSPHVVAILNVSNENRSSVKLLHCLHKLMWLSWRRKIVSERYVLHEGWLRIGYPLSFFTASTWTPHTV